MPYYGTNGFYLPFKDNSSLTALGFDHARVATSYNLTGIGDAKISTAQSKFGGASALFDGTGDALALTYSTRHQFGAGNFTIEGWIRISSLSASNTVFFTGNDGNFYNSTSLQIDTAGALRGGVYDGSSGATATSSNGAIAINTWYHVAFVRSGTSLKLYINGSENGSLTTSISPGAPSTNPSTSIGRQYGVNNASAFLNGHLDDFRIYAGVAKYTANFIAPTEALPLGSNDPYWNYILMALPMDGSNNSTTFTVYEHGNWTTTNFSITAGAGNDSLTDTPTPYADGSNGRGNYATLNPLNTGLSAITFSNGNLDFSSTGTGRSVSTLSMKSGKYYCEFTCTSTVNYNHVGIYADNISITSDSNRITWRQDGPVFKDGALLTTYGSYTNGDIIGLAFNADTFEITFYKNGVQAGASALSATNPGVGGGFYFHILTGSTSGCSGSFNFGQRPFAYTPPTGFTALNTLNLPAPAISKPSTGFGVVTYTGTGSTLSVPGLGFSPDLVWIKSRSAATDHAIYDSVRGATKDLVSNSNAAETTQSTGLTSFNANGFTVGSLAKVNTQNASYVAWCWDAGSSTVSNTAGSITSQVRANPTAGFSVATFTTAAVSSQSFGHGLGVAPSLVITRWLDASDNWYVYHSSISDKLSVLNSTAAAATSAATWGVPTSSVFAFGSGFASAHPMVAYCWAQVPGFSSFGSYTGNGNANGPFVYTGFRPAFVLIKMSSSTGNWVMLDNKRLGYNVDNEQLFSNLNNAEGTTDLVDFTANGFKIRSTDASVNTNAGTYIYAAFAENPFKNSLAR